jgi:hypothetical protein
MTKEDMVISQIAEIKGSVFLFDKQASFAVLVKKGNKEELKIGDTIEYESIGGGFGIFIRKK